MTVDYHGDYSKISKTMLNLFFKSRELYYLTYVTQRIEPYRPTRKMDIGSAIHDILLEGKDPEQLVMRFPDDCYTRDSTTKDRTNTLHSQKSKKFRADNLGKYVMKDDEADVVMAACMSVLTHPLGDLLRNPQAVFEQPVFWTCPMSGLECRCKPDFAIELDDVVLAYDLKTTELVQPEDFTRVCRRLRYWLQDAHYSAGLQTTTGKPVEFVFWGVEAKFPFRVARYQYDTASRENTRSLYAMKMVELAECYRSGDWSDAFTKATNYITVTPWELDADEDGEYGADLE